MDANPNTYHIGKLLGTPGVPEYYKYVLPHLTWMVDPTMNLIIKTYHSCERRELLHLMLQTSNGYG